MVTTDQFEFKHRPKIVHGEGSTMDIDEEIRSLESEKPLIVTDPNLVKSGVVDSVTASLSDANLEYFVFDEIESNPKVSTVQEAAEIARNEAYDSVIAVGGGSSIDSGKAVAMLATNGGTVEEHEGINKYNKPPLPVITVPTTVGTGSEVTPASVITSPDREEKLVIIGDDYFAQTAMLDPSLLESLPPTVTAFTGMDSLTQAVESYISTGANPITEALALQAVDLISENLRPAVSGRNQEAIANMQLATTLGGMAFHNSGLGLVHAMSHPVSAFFDTPHGLTNGVLLPSVLRFNMVGCPDRYAELAKRMGENTDGMSTREAAETFIESVEMLAHDLNIPPNLRDIGVDNNEMLPTLAEAVVTRADPKRNASTNPRDWTEEDVLEIYQEAY